MNNNKKNLYLLINGLSMGLDQTDEAVLAICRGAMDEIERLTADNQQLKDAIRKALSEGHNGQTEHRDVTARVRVPVRSGKTMYSLILALLLTVSLSAADLYPPVSTILPGGRITESAPIERMDGTRGLMALGDNGLVISWVTESAWAVEVVVEPTYWRELHVYGSYCRHRTGETQCVTYDQRASMLVWQRIILEDGWWRVVEIEDVEIVRLEEVDDG